MDSLANYASDGDNSNNSDDAKEETNRRASDANYDPVQMDMSEESNNNNSSRESSSERVNSPLVTQSTFSSRTESSRSLSSPSDQRRTENLENHTSSKDDHKRGERSERSSSSRHVSDKGGRRSSYDDRKQRDSSHRDSRDSKRNRDDDRKSRDEDKSRKSVGSSKDEKSDDRGERSDKDHHYRDDRRDRNRERDRRRDRDRERDRRHSRDDRSKDRHRDERSSYHKEKDRARSRSRSRDRAPLPFRTMSYREEKGRNKLAQLEKLGIELKPPEGDSVTPGVQTEQNYYNPLATATQGKYAEQIQKRKLLWANKSKPDDGNSSSTAASTANTWMGTTFTHDQDGKVTAKFKRLMGIKGDLPSVPVVGAKPDILKKQEEMFNNMEQQYEVARATTHTQRGVGLGYATGGYQFPR
ncbi:PREDICTED: arginine/serine-rich coiled-coil protein 2 isoform X2 [Dinoponera quadriceps]|uniref:Arginine/serine-rich coiled-coil protein 2 isoform X2 n=1 Tax=Dinoponera quadriceps TaxID=609295 RepID=A0A6P3Y8H9_DINQU|nr:PREDICTED: arginine/serine-rich coiled-coil protein 2 isoform X2 [Dinoponera quadriceps]